MLKIIKAMFFWVIEEQFIAYMAERYRDRGGMDWKTAKRYARDTFKGYKDGLKSDPHATWDRDGAYAVVDEDMSYWSY